MTLVHGYPDRTADTDANGAFGIEGLAPGDYHIVGVSEEEWQTKDRPQAATDLLTSGRKVTLAPKQTGAVTVTRPK